jgi:hypothetical protein
MRPARRTVENQPFLKKLSGRRAKKDIIHQTFNILKEISFPTLLRLLRLQIRRQPFSSSYQINKNRTEYKIAENMCAFRL